MNDKQTKYYSRKNSLMNNFCYFTEGSYEKNIKNMYDDSLIEWKKFQNSQINEPNQIRKNSNLITKQNLFRSLKKQKQISLNDIFKMKRKLEEEKNKICQRIDLIDIPMIVRRKSCECELFGKANSKQIQIQDLPFIPVQQKKYKDIKSRVSSILASPIKSQIKSIKSQIKSIQIKSPSSNFSKTSNLIMDFDQNKNTSFDEKSTNSFKNKVQIFSNRNIVKNETPLNCSTEKQSDDTNGNQAKQNVQFSMNFKMFDVQELTNSTPIEEIYFQKRQLSQMANRNSIFEVKELENDNISQYTQADKTETLHSEEISMIQTNRNLQSSQNISSVLTIDEYQTNNQTQKSLFLKRNSTGEYQKPHLINRQSLFKPQTTSQINDNQIQKIKFMEPLISFQDRYLKKYGSEDGLFPKHLTDKKSKKSLKNNEIQMQFGYSNTPQHMIKPNVTSPYFSKLSLEQMQNNRKSIDQNIFSNCVINNQYQTKSPSQTQFYFNQNNMGPISLLNIPSIDSLTNMKSASFNKLPVKKMTSNSSKRKQNEATFGKITNDLLFSNNQESNYFTNLPKRNTISSELYQGKQAQFSRFSCYLKSNNSPRYSQNFMSPSLRSLQQTPSSSAKISNKCDQIQSGALKNKNKISGDESPLSKIHQQPNILNKQQNSDAQYIQFKKYFSGNNQTDNYSPTKSLKELDTLLDGFQKYQQ